MIRSTASIAAQTRALAGSVGEIAWASGPADQQRYLRTSAELIGREAVKLDDAIASGDGGSWPGPSVRSPAW